MAIERSFSQHENNGQTLLELTPVDSDLFAAVTVTVERGILTTVKDTGEKTEAERFRVTFIKPKVDTTFEGIGATLEKALSSCLQRAHYGSDKDFTYDASSEFFQAAPRKNAADDDPFASDQASELYERRRVIEKLANEAMSTEVGAQTAWREVSIQMEAVFQSLGRNGKAFKAWAVGAERAGEAPWLATLGRGKNALAQTRIMAQLTDEEFSILPTQLTRGGAVDNFLRDSLRSDVLNALEVAVSESGPLVQKDDKGKHGLSDNHVLGALERFVTDVVGVVEPYSSLSEGLDKARQALADQRQEYLRTVGKDLGKVEDRKVADAAARAIMAKTRALAMAEECLVLNKRVNTLLDSGDAAGAKKVAAEIETCAFVKLVLSVVERVRTEDANERAKQKRAEKADEVIKVATPFKTTKTDSAISALDFAARLFRTMQKHPAPDAVAQYLKEMIAAHKDNLAATEPTPDPDH